MPDQSQLDQKYFVDRHRYNCAYCNRRNVVFTIASEIPFDWTDKKRCWAIYVKCSSCDNISMHLTFRNDLTTTNRFGHLQFKVDEIDEHLFYSVPSSYHVIDPNIPAELRELFDEAQGCLKSNFLTGASACARKVVYELAQRENALGDHYDERIKSLKQNFPAVDPTFFDTLLTVQELTSDKVHENAYDGWEAKHLRVIFAALKNVLNEIYVVPKMREKNRAAMLELKQQLLGGDNKPQAAAPASEPAPEAPNSNVRSN